MEAKREKQLSDLFQFPSNGKRHSKRASRCGRKKHRSFNSLQTGKGIPSHDRHRHALGDPQVSIPFKREKAFQGSSCIFKLLKMWAVSIPFKREKAFQVEPQWSYTANTKGGFNSLQTGKGIPSFQTCRLPTSPQASARSFNSLQTGKGIPSGDAVGRALGVARFQFPSNGKRHSKHTAGYPASKEIQFQFPSNGKRHSKSPHFKPSGAVPPKAQNYTRTAQDIFSIKI